jgi:hypothetical protein
MRKSIRDSSPLLQKAEELVNLANILPANTRLRIEAEELRSILELPDKFNAAFTAQGWVFVEFCCGYETEANALTMKANGNPPEEIDVYLSKQFLNIEPLYQQALKVLGGGLAEPAHPVRTEVVERAFRAYREADFIACIPLLLMLIDSFGVTRTGTKSIFSDLADLDDLFESEYSIGGHPSGLKAVLAHMVRMRKGYSEEALTLPLRNGILHGTRLNYSSEVVASKALCVLAAVIEWARDTATVPQDEVERRRWNAKFLKDRFIQLQSTSPDEALFLFQHAFDNCKPHDALALIDYHPTVTSLKSKLSEWKELMATVSITIVRKGDWQVFGASTDNEQHARCSAELIVHQKGESH